MAGTLPDTEPSPGSELAAGKQGTAFSIGFKLSLLLSVFAVLASGLTGYYAFSQSRSLLIQSAEKEMLTSAQVVGRRFSILMSGVVRDVRLLAAAPGVVEVLAGQHQDAGKAHARDHLAELFSTMLRLNPEYFQLRLIGLADHGMELVRVDRDRERLSRVDGPLLQEKAQLPYVYETRLLGPGEIFQSDIAINHELGAHQGLGQPTMQIATPVAVDGQVRGVVVINVDLDGLFALLRKDLPSQVCLLLSNDRGDYLLHPDPSLEFGFDRGRRILMQEHFPRTASLFERGERGEASQVGIMESAPGVHCGNGGHNGSTTEDAHPTSLAGGSSAELMAAFSRLSFGEHAPGQFVVLGLMVPVRDVLAGTWQLARHILQIVFGFSLLAILVAVFTSRAVTRPLQDMVGAVRQFAVDQVTRSLPSHRKDEIGLLARSFFDMQCLLKAQLETLRQKEAHLQYLVQHDTLTRLPNRLLLFDRISHAIDKAERGDRQVAVLFIDLDRFKDINDSMGHAVGDKVIQYVAQRLARYLRHGDTVARLGGDEFVVVLEDLDGLQQVVAIVQKLLLALQQPVGFDGQTLFLSASFGISLFPQDGREAETLLRNADAAMYRSKSEGRSTFHFYTEDLTRRALSRVQMESDLRQALRSDAIHCHYQPQIDLRSGRIVGVEALVRWRREDGSLAMPGDFIALAEDTGLIEAIGERVLETACCQMRLWREAGLDPGRVAVNLSGRQLRKVDYPEVVAEILRRAGCQPEWLEFEVTESSFLDRPEQAIALLERLRSTGIELAMDDFGTGYSSLTYLKHLPVGKLKIDRSFICDLPGDEDDAAITRAIIAMARSLGLRINAEGVETPAQRAFVLREGCDEAQGYLFSRPVESIEMTRILTLASQDPGHEEGKPGQQGSGPETSR